MRNRNFFLCFMNNWVHLFESSSTITLTTAYLPYVSITEKDSADVVHAVINVCPVYDATFFTHCYIVIYFHKKN